MAEQQSNSSDLDVSGAVPGVEGLTESAPPEIAEVPHIYECLVCGYAYEPAAGDAKRGIAEGTPFEALPESWRCPVCTSRKSKFRDIGVPQTPSGFAENLGYGFGVNTLTPGQKNLLIFGSLALGFLIFMSFYAVD